MSRRTKRRRAGARRPVPRRRPRPVLWLALGAGKVLLGIAPVVGVGVWLATAPVFDLELDVQVEDAERVSEEWVRNRLAPLEGRNLPLLSLAPVARRLDHEWIREAKLVKRLPNELAVRVVEHDPAATFAAGDRAWVIDRDGRAIVGCERAPDLCRGDLVRVSVEGAVAGERVADGPARNPGAGRPPSRDVPGEVLAGTLKRAVGVADRGEGVRVGAAGPNGGGHQRRRLPARPERPPGDGTRARQRPGRQGLGVRVAAQRDPGTQRPRGRGPAVQGPDRPVDGGAGRGPRRGRRRRSSSPFLAREDEEGCRRRIRTWSPSTWARPRSAC